MSKFDDVVIKMLTEDYESSVISNDEDSETCEWCGNVLDSEDIGIGSYDIGERHEKQEKFIAVCNNKLCPTKIGICPDCGLKSVKETNRGTYTCYNSDCELHV